MESSSRIRLGCVCFVYWWHHPTTTEEPAMSSAIRSTEQDEKRAEVAKSAKTAGYRVHNILKEHPNAESVPLSDAGGDEHLTVPREAAVLLLRILGGIAAGQPMTLIPTHAELTTQQAADILNVSRPHLIKLLEQGKIEHRLVGSHRRVQASSVREYGERSYALQRKAADELTQLADEMDLY